MERSTAADLLWRIKRNTRLSCDERLPDGSYLSRIYASERDWRRKTNGVTLRVIDYRLEGAADAEPIYRLVTSILDHQAAPAQELAALYHERWEIETALDELKTHLRGARIILRSKTPDLVRQEFFGLMMAHFAIRSLMHDAALKADEDSQSSLLPPRRARRPAQAPRLRRYSPLCGEPPSMTPCSRKSCKSGAAPDRTAATSPSQTQDEQLPLRRKNDATIVMCDTAKQSKSLSEHCWG